jgi:hypothetical protein
MTQAIVLAIRLRIMPRIGSCDIHWIDADKVLDEPQENSESPERFISEIDSL